MLPQRWLLGTLALLSPVAAQAARWVKVEYPGVRVYSDADPAVADRFARRLAVFHASFDLLVAPEGRAAPTSTVLLFDHASELNRYATGQEYANEFTVLAAAAAGQQLTALAVTRGQDWSARVAIAHETRHLLIGVGYSLPWWAAYGAGEVFASVEETGGGARIGRPEQRFTDNMDESRMVDWTELMSKAPPPDQDSGKEVTAPYQMEMWLLMRAVLVGPSVPQVRKRFAAFGGSLSGTSRMGRAEDQAAVGEVLNVPAREVDQHVRIVDLNIVLDLPVDTSRLQAGKKIEDAAPAQVDVLLADLLATRNPGESDQHLAAAERADPDAAVVKEALARQAARHKDPTRAIALYRAAIAAGSTDATAYLVSAEARLPDAIDKTKTPEARSRAAADAVREARRSIELEPGSPLPYLVVGRALVLSPRVTEEDLAILKPAVSDLKVGAAVEYYLGLLHRRLGKTEAARHDFQALLDDPRSGPKQKEVAQAQLAALNAPPK